MILGFAVGILLVYGLTRFRGLSDPEAMDQAQLAVSLAEGHGFTTLCVRPSDLWLLERHGRRVNPGARMPDLRHPPLYAWLLSVVFRALRGASASLRSLPPVPLERWAILPLGVGLTLATVFFLYRGAERLFDRRVAAVSAVVYLVGHSTMATAFSGTPLALQILLTTLALERAVAAVPRQDEEEAGLKMVPVLLAAVACGLACLSGYVLVALWAMMLLLLLGEAEGKRGWAAALMVTAVVIGVMAPWCLRNQAVSGSLFGTVPWQTLDGTTLTGGLDFDRLPATVVRRPWIVASLRHRFFTQIGPVVAAHLSRMAGGTIPLALWLVSFLWPFPAGAARRLQWCLAAGMLMMTAAAALGFADARDGVMVFAPWAVVYAVAAFFGVLDATGHTEAGREGILTWALVMLCAAPAAWTVAAAPPRNPFPPYHPPWIAYLGSLLQPNERLCTDIPWATAWYARRPSLLLPATPDDFMTLHRGPLPCAALYLTTETTDRFGASHRQAGPLSGWLPLLQGVAPADFPFQHGLVFPPGTRDQMFLADRPRWDSADPSSPP